MPIKKWMYLLIIALLLVSAIYYFVGRQFEEPQVDIRGAITSLNPSIDTDTVFMMVEGSADDTTMVERASIRIVPKDTKIYRMVNGKRMVAAVSDLFEGQVVEADFGDNPVAESHPIQPKAKSVTIIAEN